MGKQRAENSNSPTQKTIYQKLSSLVNVVSQSSFNAKASEKEPDNIMMAPINVSAIKHTASAPNLKVEEESGPNECVGPLDVHVEINYSPNPTSSLPIRVPIDMTFVQEEGISMQPTHDDGNSTNFFINIQLICKSLIPTISHWR